MILLLLFAAVAAGEDASRSTSMGWTDGRRAGCGAGDATAANTYIS